LKNEKILEEEQEQMQTFSSLFMERKETVEKENLTTIRIILKEERKICLGSNWLILES
jgi:hypothetical protein